MPFGVRNVPAVFQTLMDRILQGKQDFVRAYVDDLVILGKSIGNMLRKP